ncbi:hypothetical protein [Microseira sp. BLCC-F43]|jgi:hypothetical protein|uniref:hypothetical protein n=1 Tax=Microseira sp. BLCC-F43 TaxID=3153602 RepID=UPI0035BB882D
MEIIWGDQEYVNLSAIATLPLPPNETPVSPWDTWDFRGLFNQPVVNSQQMPPNNLPLAYPIPWQVYPR